MFCNKVFGSDRSFISGYKEANADKYWKTRGLVTRNIILVFVGLKKYSLLHDLLSSTYQDTLLTFPPTSVLSSTVSISLLKKEG